MNDRRWYQRDIPNWVRLVFDGIIYFAIIGVLIFGVVTISSFLVKALFTVALMVALWVGIVLTVIANR